nr:MAG TPA: hypothetical protein [Caudoviricetes sp.]
MNSLAILLTPTKSNRIEHLTFKKSNSLTKTPCFC